MANKHIVPNCNYKCSKEAIESLCQFYASQLQNGLFSLQLHGPVCWWPRSKLLFGISRENAFTELFIRQHIYGDCTWFVVASDWTLWSQTTAFPVLSIHMRWLGSCAHDMRNDNVLAKILFALLRYTSSSTSFPPPPSFPSYSHLKNPIST